MQAVEIFTIITGHLNNFSQFNSKYCNGKIRTSVSNKIKCALIFLEMSNPWKNTDLKVPNYAFWVVMSCYQQVIMRP